jgi:hypothetical protein
MKRTRQEREKRRPADAAQRPAPSAAGEEEGTLASGAPEPAPEGPARDETGQTAGNKVAWRTGGGSG